MDAPDVPREHDLSIRGVRVRYCELGVGPPLVLVHGFLTNSRAWRLVMPTLARHFRVIAPDLPGFGASARPDEYRYDREGYAETICDLLAGLDIPRAHVAGHSFGGAIALSLAADHPERVERLAVINTVSYPHRVSLTGRLALAPVLGPVLFKRLYGRTLVHQFFKRSLYAPGFAYDRSAVDSYYDAFTPRESRSAAYRVLHASADMASLGPKIRKVRAPTLIVWGERDAQFPLTLATRLARDIAGSRLDTLAESGHTPPEEMPERTAELLLRHFRSEAR